MDNGSDLVASPTSVDHVTQHPKYSSGRIELLAACLKRAIHGLGRPDSGRCVKFVGSAPRNVQALPEVWGSVRDVGFKPQI